MTEQQTNELKAMYKQACKSLDKANTEAKKDIYRAEVIQLERIFNLLGIEY